jgi:hypothetical protein
MADWLPYERAKEKLMNSEIPELNITALRLSLGADASILLECLADGHALFYWIVPLETLRDGNTATIEGLNVTFRDD